MIEKLIENVMSQGLSLSLLCVAVLYLRAEIADCKADRQKLWNHILNRDEN